MMMQEFTDRTGFEPMHDEYKAIEEAYYTFNGNKDEFCADWLKNGGPEKIAEERAWKIEQLNSRILELDRQLRQTSEQYEKQIARLKDELEREQEWTPYTDTHMVAQEKYDHIRSAGREMSDQEAADWIAQEFGFAVEKIRVNRLMKTFEVNRHHQLRKVGEIDRRPMYDATDWYYVFFSVAGFDYEAYNGTLNQI